MSLLRHPSRPLLYIGIQRGGRIAGRPYPYANCYVATYDLAQHRYLADAQLAEIINGTTEDATPACLTYDDIYDRVYVGMFQSLRGICVLDADSGQWLRDIRFERTSANTSPFPWVDPMCQATAGPLLLTVKRHNHELVSLDRESLQPKSSVFLGGAGDLVVWKDYAIVSDASRKGLHLIPLSTLS